MRAVRVGCSGLTHVRRLRDVGEGVERMNERMAPLVERGQLGPLVVAAAAQPPARRRHESWFHRAVYDRLGEHGVALVIADHPKWPFQARELTTDWTLVRLHHGHRGRRRNYSATELDEWAEWIRASAGAARSSST